METKHGYYLSVAFKSVEVIGFNYYRRVSQQRFVYEHVLDALELTPAYCPNYRFPNLNI